LIKLLREIKIRWESILY